MRESEFSESQIVGILKEAEAGIPVVDLVRRHAVSKATSFKWRSKYAGASVPDMKRLRELEAENTKLKRMYADLALENAVASKTLLVRNWRLGSKSRRAKGRRARSRPGACA